MSIWEKLLWLTIGLSFTGLMAILITTLLGGPDLGWLAIMIMWGAIRMYGSIMAMFIAFLGLGWLIRNWRWS